MEVRIQKWGNYDGEYLVKEFEWDDSIGDEIW